MRCFSSFPFRGNRVGRCGWDHAGALGDARVDRAQERRQGRGRHAELCQGRLLREERRDLEKHGERVFQCKKRFGTICSAEDIFGTMQSAYHTF